MKQHGTLKLSRAGPLGCAVTMASLAGCGLAVTPPPLPDETGGEATFASLVVPAVAGADVDAQQPATDVMREKLDQAAMILLTPRLPSEVYEGAVEQVMEALGMSNLTVLPSAGADESAALFNQWLGMIDAALFALDEHVVRGCDPGDIDGDGDVDLADALGLMACFTGPNGGVPDATCACVDFDGDHDVDLADHVAFQSAFTGALSGGPQDEQAGTPTSRTAAAEAANFLRVWREAAVVIGERTAQCEPEAVQDSDNVAPECLPLVADDERGVAVDVLLSGFERQVRSPFFLGTADRTMQEQVVVPDTVAKGDCVTVLKEVQGVEALVRPIQIPIWIEPWFARARIVGTRTVWIWEFVPAEFLKTITYCNMDGTVQSFVDTQLILERQLLPFWRFLHKSVQTSGKQPAGG